MKPEYFLVGGKIILNLVNPTVRSTTHLGNLTAYRLQLKINSTFVPLVLINQMNNLALLIYL